MQHMCICLVSHTCNHACHNIIASITFNIIAMTTINRVATGQGCATRLRNPNNHVCACLFGFLNQTRDPLPWTLYHGPLISFTMDPLFPYPLPWTLNFLSD